MSIAQERSRGEEHDPDEESQVVVCMVAAPWIAATWSALAAVLVHYGAYVLPGPDEGLVNTMLIIALIFAGIGALIVSVTAVVLGVGGAWWLAIAIQRPRRPLWVADSGNALAVIGQVIASCMAMAAWAVACAVIEAVNLMVRLVAFTLLWIWASLVVAARISWRAAVTAFRGVFDPVVSIFVPVATLLVTRLSPAFRF